jgi:hypothetical protein
MYPSLFADSKSDRRQGLSSIREMISDMELFQEIEITFRAVRFQSNFRCKLPCVELMSAAPSTEWVFCAVDDADSTIAAISTV